MEHWPTLEFLKLLLVLLLFFAAGYWLYRLQTMRRERHLHIFSAETIDDNTDIKTLLDTVARQRVRLRIRLNERRRSYSSSLIQIADSSLLIDALFPAEGNELIRDAGFIVVDFVLKGIEQQRLHLPYSFRSVYGQAEDFNGFPALRISFPRSITRNQKRSYLRISPPVNEPLFIEYAIGGRKMKEKIINISGGGLSFYTNQGKSVLSAGKLLDNISVALPADTVIQCSLIIRKLSQNEQPVFIDGIQIFNYCGAEFIELDETTRNKLIKYVVEKERLELRHLSREF
jgi:c-di-GMP-binding flagellar brake protein YcgR